jgi:TetR/AcrR family transcriptional repressor of nem operon
MNLRTGQKQQSHESILESAACLLREKGVAGASVAGVMERAGLTVGGFYAHFASKDELVDEALQRTAAELRARLFAGLDAPAIEAVLGRYLSQAHRDSAALGCPFPAVAGEIGSTAPQHGAVLAGELEALTSSLAAHLPGDGIVSRRMLALGLVALMVGGLTLSRAVRGTALSDEVLRACRALGAKAALRSSSTGRASPTDRAPAGHRRGRSASRC